MLTIAIVRTSLDTLASFNSYSCAKFLSVVFFSLIFTACTPRASLCDDEQTRNDVLSFVTTPLKYLVAEQDIFFVGDNRYRTPSFKLFAVGPITNVTLSDIRAVPVPFFSYSRERACSATVTLILTPREMKPIKVEAPVTFKVGKRGNERLLLMSDSFKRPMVKAAEEQARIQVQGWSRVDEPASTQELAPVSK